MSRIEWMLYFAIVTAVMLACALAAGVRPAFAESIALATVRCQAPAKASVVNVPIAVNRYVDANGVDVVVVEGQCGFDQVVLEGDCACRAPLVACRAEVYEDDATAVVACVRVRKTSAGLVARVRWLERRAR